MIKNESLEMRMEKVLYKRLKKVLQNVGDVFIEHLSPASEFLLPNLQAGYSHGYSATIDEEEDSISLTIRGQYPKLIKTTDTRRELLNEEVENVREVVNDYIVWHGGLVVLDDGKIIKLAPEMLTDFPLELPDSVDEYSFVLIGLCGSEEQLEQTLNGLRSDRLDQISEFSSNIYWICYVKDDS